MIGTGIHGLNALQTILASGFAGVTELGALPESVVALAALPEPVRLVHASERLAFHLAAKSTDPIRNDTSIYRWLVEVAPSVVQTPDYYVAGTKPGQFQLLKRVAAPPQYPTREFAHFFIKFFSAANAASGLPELWLGSAVCHDAKGARRLVRKGVLLASNNALEQTRDG